MVQDRTREAMRKALESRNLSMDTGEGYVIGIHMDLIEKVMSLDEVNQGTLKLVHTSLGELADYLDMKGEREKITTTNTLQLTTAGGTAIAQQIEQRRLAQQEQDTAEEVKAETIVD